MRKICEESGVSEPVPLQAFLFKCLEQTSWRFPVSWFARDLIEHMLDTSTDCWCDAIISEVFTQDRVSATARRLSVRADSGYQLHGTE
jgi:hypothetical protein